MSPASRSPAWPRWRTVCAAAACAAAGGGLRLGVERHHAPDTSSTSSASSPTASVKIPVPALPALTPETLPSRSRLDRLQSLAARLPTMTVEEIEPLVRSLMTRFPTEEDTFSYNNTAEALMPALLMRWAELDAPGMITTLEAPESRYALSLRQAAVRAWAELQGLSALEAVAQKWPGLAANAAWDVLQRQPGQLGALLPLLITAQDDGLFGPLYDDAAFRERLGTDRYWKLAVAHSRDKQLTDFLLRVNQTEPLRAWELAKSLPQSRFRDAVFQSLLSGLPLDPENSPDTGLNFRTEYEALPATSKLRDEFVETYAEFMARKDPEAALTWARSLTSASLKAEALRTIADVDRPPADRSRLLAEAWLADPGEPEHFQADSFKEWHAADPNAAEAWLKTVPHAGLRDALADAVNPSGKSAPAIAPEVSRELARLAAATQGGVKDEVWAAATTEERRYLSAEAIKYRAGHNQLEEALKLFESMAPAERSLQSWYEAAKANIHRDPQTAPQWIAAIPAGAERDAAATALVNHLSGGVMPANFAPGTAAYYRFDPVEKRDGATAFEWTASMSGEAERTTYMSQAARVWAQADPGAARAAVAASSLPDAAKQSLLKRLPEGGAR